MKEIGIFYGLRVRISKIISLSNVNKSYQKVMLINFYKEYDIPKKFDKYICTRTLKKEQNILI